MPFEPAEATEPQGPLSYATRKAAEMLADCPAFRAALDVESQDEALESIYPLRRVMQWAAEPDRPFAVIWAWPFRFAQRGGPSPRLSSLTMNVHLSAPAGGGAPQGEPGVPDFLAWLDAICRELAGLSGVDDRLVLQDIAADGLGLPNFDADGDRATWKAGFTCTVGATGGE